MEFWGVRLTWLDCKRNSLPKKKQRSKLRGKINERATVNFIIYFFPSLRAGGILKILQSDWFRREQAVFYDLAHVGSFIDKFVCCL